MNKLISNSGDYFAVSTYDAYGNEFTGREEWIIVSDKSLEYLLAQYPETMRAFAPFVFLSGAMWSVFENDYRLKDKFRSDAGLSLVSSGADLQFSGNITDYTTSYQGVTASQLAAQTRLTIAVKIKFVNKNDEKQNYEKRFSAYRDFDATESLSNVEDALIAEISEEIIESIFMESVANW